MRRSKEHYQGGNERGHLITIITIMTTSIIIINIIFIITIIIIIVIIITISLGAPRRERTRTELRGHESLNTKHKLAGLETRGKRAISKVVDDDLRF